MSIGHHRIGQRVGGHHVGHAIGVDVGKHGAALAVLGILKAPSHQAGVAGSSPFNATAPHAIECHSLGGSLHGANQGRFGVGEAHGADFAHRGHLKAHLRANKQLVALALGEPRAHWSGIFRNDTNDVSGSVAVKVFQNDRHHAGSTGTEFGGCAGGVFVQWPDGNLSINNADQFLGAAAYQVGNRERVWIGAKIANGLLACNFELTRLGLTHEHHSRRTVAGVDHVHESVAVPVAGDHGFHGTINGHTFALVTPVFRELVDAANGWRVIGFLGALLLKVHVDAVLEVVNHHNVFQPVAIHVGDHQRSSLRIDFQNFKRSKSKVAGDVVRGQGDGADGQESEAGAGEPDGGAVRADIHDGYSA